jgi:hypothetical protein
MPQRFSTTLFGYMALRGAGEASALNRHITPARPWRQAKPGDGVTTAEERTIAAAVAKRERRAAQRLARRHP